MRSRPFLYPAIAAAYYPALALLLFVAIEALLLGTPIIVFAVLAFRTGALRESAHSLSSAVGMAAFLTVATVVTALNPFLWLVSSGFVSILRSASEIEAAERSERAGRSGRGSLREPPGE
jgi:hypothetical protein